MIDLNQVTLLRNDRAILHNINLTVKDGEVVLLAGESGSGKSSLISILNGLIPELYDGTIEGNAIVGGDNLPPIDFNEYVKQIGVVFQNPKTQFFTTSVLSELAFSMENYGFDPNDITNRMNEIIDLFELHELLDKKVSELSGGQKQRIAFASACMISHRLFLFDEPSSNLDYESINQLSSYIAMLKQAGHTVLIAEHRLFYLVQLIDRVVILKQGQIAYDLDKKEFISNFNQIKEDIGLRALSEPKITHKQNASTNQIKSLECIEVQKLRFSYDRNRPFLMIENLTLDPTKIVGIIGENGSGKSTFVQILTGIQPEKQVEIYQHGRRLTSKERLKRSFMVMQDVNLQLFFETVEKELFVQSKRSELLDEVVSELNLTTLLKRHPQDLSGGEKQRVAVGSAILSGKKWIILDEPTSGLDYQNMLAVSRLLKKAQSYGLFIVVISHDNEFLSKTADCVLKMKQGRIVSVDQKKGVSE